MKRTTTHQVIPSIIMAGAAAVPVVTTVQILRSMSGGAPGVALGTSVPVAAAPRRSSAAPATSPPSGPAGSHTYSGTPVHQTFGPVQATITVSGKRISDVAISAPQSDSHSAAINQQAAPILRSETLQAQSAQINLVSGATLTSEAYAQSLQSALDQARQEGNAPTGNPASSQSGSNSAGGSTPAPSVSASGDD